jgi:acetyl-CoA synthetase
MSDVKKFAPLPQFSASAHVKSEAIAEQFRNTAQQFGDTFWAELARVIHFHKPYHSVLDWSCPHAQWFVGGTLNVCESILDKHLSKQGGRTAILWEAEPVKDNVSHVRRVSYKELYELTCQIALALKNLGAQKGDRVAIYMPMVPETVASMLACARLGLVHTVIFGGFSAQAIADRCLDSGARFIVTADGTYRKGQFLHLKKAVDDALVQLGDKSPVESVLVFKRDSKQACPMVEGRDHDWSLVLSQEKSCAAEPMDSEDPLFILYTSGTTGKPKGLYHTQAGYLLWAHWTTRWLFDLQENDIYWCTADCGWITGHTYVTYGPLSNGTTVFMYEGAPTTPHTGRFWEMIEKHRISVLYTAPTAIRTFMKFGDEIPKKYDLKSLRVLGSVGEPINPEAWLWFYEKIGGSKCPVVDTWWQTETGGAMIAPFPGASTLKPGSATRPLPGIDAHVVDPQTGEPLPPNTRGALVIKSPWPSMARGIWGDRHRFESTYWKTSAALDGVYVTSDFALVDDDGDYWIEGRMDDVLKLSGHRLGSAEVESALVSHHKVAEAAAVGIPDPVKGQSLVVFVTVKTAFESEVVHHESAQALKSLLREHVGKEVGAHAKPDQVRFAKALPKTRSGKIMRRLLRELGSTGTITGDTSTLEDFSPQAALVAEED